MWVLGASFTFEPAEAVARLRAMRRRAGHAHRTGRGPSRSKSSWPTACSKRCCAPLSISNCIVKQPPQSTAACWHCSIDTKVRPPKLSHLRRTKSCALRGSRRGELAAVRDLAAKCQAGVVPILRKTQNLTDDEFVARLQRCGHQPWTVHMLNAVTNSTRSGGENPSTGVTFITFNCHTSPIIRPSGQAQQLRPTRKRSLRVSSVGDSSSGRANGW